MRFLSNLLVGLPLAGLIFGSCLFLYQAIHNFTNGPQEWKPCMVFLTWLFKKWNIWDKTASITDMYCHLSIGAHIAIGSIVLGFILVPLGLALSKRS